MGNVQLQYFNCPTTHYVAVTIFKLLHVIISLATSHITQYHRKIFEAVQSGLTP